MLNRNGAILRSCPLHRVVFAFATAACVAGCGLAGSSDAPADSEAASETAAAPAGPSPKNFEPNQAPAPGGPGGPAIVASPAAGGGVVVGDPFDSGPNPAAVAPGNPAAAAPGNAAAQNAVNAGNAADAAHAGNAADAAANSQPPRPLFEKGKREFAANGPQPGPGGAPFNLEEAEEAERVANASAAGQPGVPLSIGGQPGAPAPGGPAGQPPNFGIQGSGKRDKKDKGDSPFTPGQRPAVAERGILDNEDGGIPPGPAAGFPPQAGPAGNAPSAAAGTIGGPRFGFNEEEDDVKGGGRGGAGIGSAGGEIVIDRDSAEAAATAFFDLLAAGDIDRAKTLIAGHATGLLAKLRDGEIKDEELKELQAHAAARQQLNARPLGGTHIRLTYEADDKMMLVEAVQKEGESSVVKLQVRSVPRRRR